MLDENITLDTVDDLVVAPGTTEYVTSTEFIDYTGQIDFICSIGLIIIFMLGLLAGVSLGKILWERVTVWS